MGDEDRDILSGGAGGKGRIQKARRLFGDLASRLPDPAGARRLEAALNDAWLRLQFALVADDPALVRVERQTCARLLAEARREGDPRRPPS